MSLLNAHTCTRKYMYVVNETKCQTQSHLVISQVFVLYFIFVPISISSILFNSLLQLLIISSASVDFNALHLVLLSLFHENRQQNSCYLVYSCLVLIVQSAPKKSQLWSATTFLIINDCPENLPNISKHPVNIVCMWLDLGWSRAVVWWHHWRSARHLVNHFVVFKN